MEDTIYACATAPGRAGVAIIRISGPKSIDVLAAFGASCPPPSHARLRRLYGSTGQVLDEALVLYFEEGKSFTGECVIELHVHGSIAVIRAIILGMTESGLAREARAGEFTQRALLNGCLNLTEVQGLGDLIEAETEQQRVQAMRMFDGELTNLVQNWRTALIRACALIEASIDFVDEEVPPDVLPEVIVLLNEVVGSIDDQLAASSSAMRLRSGFEVAIVGDVNVGKSTLLNAIAQSDVAIVSEYPGTTRDIIEVKFDIKGIPVIFLDTAGLRDTNDPVEKIGIGRAYERATRADLRILLYVNADLPEKPIFFEVDDLVLRSKCDLIEGNGVSGLTGEGIADLLERIGQILENRLSSIGLISTERDITAVRAIRDMLVMVVEKAHELEAEFLADELHETLRIAGRILGDFDVEIVLDEIFRSFCIGK